PGERMEDAALDARPFEAAGRDHGAVPRAVLGERVRPAAEDERRDAAGPQRQEGVLGLLEGRGLDEVAHRAAGPERDARGERGVSLQHLPEGVLERPREGVTAKARRRQEPVSDRLRAFAPSRYLRRREPVSCGGREVAGAEEQDDITFA